MKDHGHTYMIYDYTEYSKGGTEGAMLYVISPNFIKISASSFAACKTRWSHLLPVCPLWAVSLTGLVRPSGVSDASEPTFVSLRLN